MQSKLKNSQFQVMRSTREQSVELNQQFSFNNSINYDQNDCLESRNKLNKAVFPQKYDAKPKAMLKRSKSCQFSTDVLFMLNFAKKQEILNGKQTETKQIASEKHNKMFLSHPTLKQLNNENQENAIFQKRKTLQQRKHEKINFINDKINKLKSITDKLNLLKGQILTNLQNLKPLPEQASQNYYISDLLKNSNGSVGLQKNSAHFKHFSLNFKILKSLKKQHSLISRPFSCKKIVKNPNMIIQELPTLVLDLDETLIWTEKTDKLIAKNIIYLRDEQGNKNVRHEVILRPYLHKFLEQASKLFEIIVFTAGTYEYTNQILKFIDPQRCYIARVLTKEHTTKFQGKYEGRIKDLRVLGRNLRKTVFVDNNIFSYALQLENGVPIIPFQGDATDEELLKLLEYLKELQKQEDLMAKNDSVFNQSKLRNYFNRNNVEDIAISLFKNQEQHYLHRA